jgi:hypothetical protein
MLKRYGPILIVVLIIAGVVIFASSGGDDDDDVSAEGNGDTPSETVDGEETPESDVPLIYSEAVEQGIEGDIDWGPNCDLETGRLKVPITGAAPCVEPWDDSKDNGGATAQGVTADEILIVVYKGEPDPLAQAAVAATGADTDPDAVNKTTTDYVKLMTDVYETYGRKVRIEVIEASGQTGDAVAAAADAQRAIDMKPFAVVGGPLQTTAWSDELTAAGIVCVGQCSLAEPWDDVVAVAPYLWPTGPAPDQADAHTLEMIEKQLIGKPVSFGGDEINGQDRVFGFVQAERTAGEFEARNKAFVDGLEEAGADVAAQYTYLFDVGRAGETATNAIARMKDAGVTSVILSVDPIIPVEITKEATRQNYHPEWILGPSVLMDTTVFSRPMDQEQWSHMVGISLPAAHASREESDSYKVYEWYYGTEPPVNGQAAIFPGPERLALGLHLAGPNLTPETFRDGLFRSPLAPAGVTYARDSWGTKTWDDPRPDYNASDDVAAIWWDPEAEGEDETGQMSQPGVAGKTGMLRYVNDGERYMPGEWPTDPLPFFDRDKSITVYDKRPDAAPDYPTWPGSPADAG